MPGQPPLPALPASHPRFLVSDPTTSPDSPPPFPYLFSPPAFRSVNAGFTPVDAQEARFFISDPTTYFGPDGDECGPGVVLEWQVSSFSTGAVVLHTSFLEGSPDLVRCFVAQFQQVRGADGQCVSCLRAGSISLCSGASLSGVVVVAIGCVAQ